VVTSRSVDIGNFVAAGNASGTPLFTVSDQNRLRLYVRVPQGYSAQVVPGTKASFTVPEYPGRSFTATVGASASAVDSSSGSVLVQLLADNSEKLLKPGSYAQVRFAFTAPAVSAEIPSSALIFRNGGMAVAAVGPKNKVVFRPVEILRDNGATVQLASSFERGERIIDNPPDSLGQGDEVRVASKAAGRN
jgi:RND family efflux transporter MFP subunit